MHITNGLYNIIRFSTCIACREFIQLTFVFQLTKYPIWIADTTEHKSAHTQDQNKIVVKFTKEDS